MICFECSTTTTGCTPLKYHLCYENQSYVVQDTVPVYSEINTKGVYSFNVKTGGT